MLESQQMSTSAAIQQNKIKPLEEIIWGKKSSIKESLPGQIINSVQGQGFESAME